MGDKLQRYFTSLLQSRQKHFKWLSTFLCLALAVTLTTSAILSMSAVAVTDDRTDDVGMVREDGTVLSDATSNPDAAVDAALSGEEAYLTSELTGADESPEADQIDGQLPSEPIPENETILDEFGDLTNDQAAEQSSVAENPEAEPSADASSAETEAEDSNGAEDASINSNETSGRLADLPTNHTETTASHAETAGNSSASSDVSTDSQPESTDISTSDPSAADSTADSTIAAATEDEQAHPFPAQSFDVAFTDLTIHVEADEGAFPADTTMVVTPVSSADVTTQVEQAVAAEITHMQAVDISFYNTENVKIEPLIPIRVSMRSTTLADVTAPQVVHIKEDNASEVVEQIAPEVLEQEALAKEEAERLAAENADSTANPAGDASEAADTDKTSKPGLLEGVLNFITGNKTTDATAAEPEIPAGSASDPEAPAAEVNFDADSFSIYAIVGTLENNLLATDGQTYRVSVTYDASAQIPEGATLAVSEIVPDTENYASYLSQAAETLGAADRVSYAKFIDISIWKDGQQIQPAAPVSVCISLLTQDAVENENNAETTAQVVHFGDAVEVIDGVQREVVVETAAAEEEAAEVLTELTTENAAVNTEKDAALDESDSEVSESGSESAEMVSERVEMTFAAHGFSVYGIVYTVDFHWNVNGKTYDFSIPGGGFISFRELVEVLGLVEKDADLETDSEISEAVNADTEGTAAADTDQNAYQDLEAFVSDIANIEFSAPHLVSVIKVDEDTTVGGIKDSLGLASEYSAEMTEEQIAEINAQTVSAGDWALISLQAFDTEETLTVTMQDGEVFAIKVTDIQDPLGLDGRTFSILTKRQGTTGHALQANVHTVRDQRGYYLESLNVNLNDGTQYATVDGVEYVRQEATAWKFEYNAQEDAYYVSHNGKYLCIDPSITTKNSSQDHSLNLVTDKSTAGTLIKITRDADENYYFGNTQGTLIFDYGNGYWLSNPQPDEGGNTTNAKIRLCLPENPYGSHRATLTAAKELSTGQTIVIYQKVWNSEIDAYDYYAVDGNGKLQKVWESSDALYWKEDVSIEWKFREELDAEGNPTGYLQLYNENTKTYLAPKTDGSGYSTVHAAASLTTEDMKKIRVSLPGRDAGAYASRIATWDYDANTTYGLEIRKNNQGVVNAGDPVYVNELLKSQEFFFAARDPLVQKQLTTVDTVDSASKGITIKMYNFDDNNHGWDQRLPYIQRIIRSSSDYYYSNDWSSGQYTPGLMNRVLVDGWPVASETGKSLSAVFVNPEANRDYEFTTTPMSENANHLFLQSVYDTTGYFYYSGFDNFARLDGNDFVVYEQLGTPQNKGTNNDGTPSSPSNFFYYRGNFMPFNELDTTKQVVNYYEGGDQKRELQNGDPRKGEDLYQVKGKPDYFFGMTMETKFLQGPNGLSDQGDPMVFEFTGDDDMWVYVDDVLLLDIGGVHDAFHGKINFQTGKIHVDGQKTGDEDTYIREQYWQAHRYPDGSAWTDRDDPKQFTFFTDFGEDNGKLAGTYLDYSTHDLKMFYMERGAGASNLQIQFNLPVITGDEFRVTKNMLTTATGEPIQSAYADAAFYYKAYVKQNGNWVEYKKTDFPTGKKAVYDDENHTDVVWKEGSDVIFEVKPGQTAIIPVRDSQVEYKVVEVEPEENSHMLDVFNVSNSDPDPQDSRSTTGKIVKKRGQVFFDNKPVDEIVNELRITKKLHGDLYRDEHGNLITADETGSPYFEYRIYLEATDGKMSPYSLGEYYQIDGETGKYVYYDSGKSGTDKRCLADTETAGDGTVTYIYRYANGSVERLPEPKITEHTSQNGSLGDVRPDDTIIIKGLLEGTDFIVDERVDRSHMTLDNTGNWDNKYYYSHTDVSGAYIRGSGEILPVDLPENLEIAGTIYDQPLISEQIAGLLTGKQAAGTIVANKDSEVNVHNEVYNTFLLPLVKEWSGDFDLDQLDTNTKVTFQLKRYKLQSRTGELTLNAVVTGQPAGYDQTYILRNETSGESYTVKFSEMSGSEQSRSIALSLPVGTYAVVCEGAPEGYGAEHTKSTSRVTVTSDDTSGTGAVPSPNEISFNSVFTQQSGTLQVIKKLEGYHGNNSFENFKALYFITDLAGNIVKNVNGATVNLVNLKYADFQSSTQTVISFEDLPAGRYLVREQLNGTAYDNEKYTIENTADPESLIVSVGVGQPSQIVFTSTYTMVESNPVRIVVKDVAYNRSEIKYDNNTSFRPGDQISISFMRQAVNSNIRYRINNGSWKQTTVKGANGNVREEILLTVPTEGVILEINDPWDWNTWPNSLSVSKVQTTSTQSNQTQNSANSMSLLSSRRNGYEVSIKGTDNGEMLLAATNAVDETTDIDRTENTGTAPNPSDSKQMYQTDSWQLSVTMKNGGQLLDKDGRVIGSWTTEAGGKWAVSLKGADFEGLSAADDNGNLYYYYIDAISEESVPVGTVAEITTEEDGSKYLYSENDQKNSTGRRLSAVNRLIQSTQITLKKVDQKNLNKSVIASSDLLNGAKFKLEKYNSLSPMNKDAAWNEAHSSVTAGSDGVFTFTDLPVGIYRVIETQSPNGYVKVSSDPFIEIGADLHVYLLNEQGQRISGNASETVRVVENSTEIIVANSPGAALPNTGGPGTDMYKFLGLLLTIGAGILLLL